MLVDCAAVMVVERVVTLEVRVVVEEVVVVVVLPVVDPVPVDI